MFIVGVTVIIDPDIKPGVQVYVFAPLALKVDTDPSQIVVELAVTDKIGFGFTVIVILFEYAGEFVVQNSFAVIIKLITS